ncbi:MAG TPA: hypothetical protein VF307_07810 [Candidatus Nanopelagicaceae bacterium]
MISEFSRALITGAELAAVIPLRRAIQSQREVFAALARGQAIMGARGVVSNGADAQFAYIARASELGPTVVKFGSVTPGNAQRELPIVQSYIGVMNPTNGSLEYFVDGEMTTRIRTTAASMLAAQILANPVRRIAVVGTGHTAIAHIEACLELFSPENITVLSRRENLVFLNQFPTGSPIKITQDENEALDQADLIFVCTNSNTPVLASTLAPGATLISIGSFAPNREEIAGLEVLKANAIYADDAQTAMNQCGSLVSANGHANATLHVTSIGDVINNVSPGRVNENQSIMYFSVGLGVQDAAIVETFLSKS